MRNSICSILLKAGLLAVFLLSLDCIGTSELSAADKSLEYSTFEGSVVLRAQSAGAFVAVGLIQNQTLFTVVPVVPGKAPHIPD
jgi:hypothetical protein